ncbi:MAG TPA: hypothetical protein VIV12_12930 [Streptosporangiaceae bacterium]
MTTAIILAAGVLYALIVAGTWLWLQLQARLDRLELLTFPPRHHSSSG